MEGSLVANPHLFSMPKQHFGAIVNSQFSAGVSSFAFQGTNAHLVMGASLAASSAAEEKLLPHWRRHYIHVLPPAHPQLWCISAIYRAGTVSFEMRLGHPALAFFCDHQVSSKIIFPGAGYMEMLAAAGKALLNGNSAALAVTGASISAPLIINQTAFAPQLANFVLRAEVHINTGAASLFTDSTVHVSTTYTRLHGSGDAELDTTIWPAERLMAECTMPLDPAYVYQQLSAGSLQYGPAFRLLRDVKQGRGIAAAKVRQQEQRQPLGFQMDPAVLDSCLQLGGMVPQQRAASSSNATYVPATLSALRVGHAIGQGMAVAAAQRPAGVDDADLEVVRNHMIVGGNGCLVCHLEGLKSKSTSRSKLGSGNVASKQGQDMLYNITWTASASQIAREKTCALEHVCSKLSVSTGQSSALAASGIAAVQAGLASHATALQLRTRGQHAVHALPAGITTGFVGQLWGLIRTVAQECPSLAVSGSDVDAFSLDAGASAQLLLGTANHNNAFDGYGTATFASADYLPFMGQLNARPATQPYQLLPMPRGALNNLQLQPVDMSTVKPGQVVVATKAVGLNFRQVQTAINGKSSF